MGKKDKASNASLGKNLINKFKQKSTAHKKAAAT